MSTTYDLANSKLSFPLSYDYEIVNSNEKSIKLRLGVTCSEEFKSWLENFSVLNATSWVVRKTIPCVKLVHKASYLCHRSSCNKSTTERPPYVPSTHPNARKPMKVNRASKSTGCEASLSVKIKKLNRSTKKNDPFLRQIPPLPAEITINNSHNHDLESPDNLRQLRVAPETKQIFEDYFNQGMCAASARAFHENKIRETMADPTLALANSQLNPTVRQVNHLYDTWRKANVNNCPSRVIPTNVEENIHMNDELPASLVPSLSCEIYEAAMSISSNSDGDRADLAEDNEPAVDSIDKDIESWVSCIREMGAVVKQSSSPALRKALRKQVLMAQRATTSAAAVYKYLFSNSKRLKAPGETKASRRLSTVSRSHAHIPQEGPY